MKVIAIKMFQAVEVGDSKNQKSSITHVNDKVFVGGFPVTVEKVSDGFLLRCGDDTKWVGNNNICYAKIEEPKAPAKK